MSAYIGVIQRKQLFYLRVIRITVDMDIDGSSFGVFNHTFWFFTEVMQHRAKLLMKRSQIADLCALDVAIADVLFCANYYYGVPVHLVREVWMAMIYRTEELYDGESCLNSAVGFQPNKCALVH